MDVRFLFTEIPHKKRIEAAKTSFNRSNVLSNVIITFLHLMLLSKNFAFNCQGYLQTEAANQPEAFLRKCVLKICSKFTGERCVISTKSHFGMGVLQ